MSPVGFKRLLAAAVVTALVGCGASQEQSIDDGPAATESDTRDGGDASPVSGTPVEATSLLGRPLLQPTFSESRRELLEANLQSARDLLEEEPDSEDAIVWVGRRLAYLGRYREAIETYSAGLASHPESFRLLRHRGHRYITLRRFDDAVRDLGRAAELMAGHPVEVEEDGIPNRLGVPLSNTQFNVWYHLGLAHYLLGDFESALEAYRRCLAVSDNPDLLVATTDWMYMTLQRLGRATEAEALLEPITDDLEIIENVSYFKRLKLYRGALQPEQLLSQQSPDSPPADPDSAEDPALELATQGYGVGHWYWLTGQREEAISIFESVLEGSSWAAFGYIAAEAELARIASTTG